METHEFHTDPDGLYDSTQVLYGPLPSLGETWRTEEDIYLLKCCELDRPWDRGKTELVIKATGDLGFVTIRDCISIVPDGQARRHHQDDQRRPCPGWLTLWARDQVDGELARCQRHHRDGRRKMDGVPYTQPAEPVL